MKINKPLALLVSAFSLAGVASAQTERIDRPWKIDLGVHFPTGKESGVNMDTGATIGFGYRAVRLQGFDLEAEVRGVGYRVSDAIDRGDLSISQFALNAVSNNPDQPVFYGLGLGFGRGSISSGGFTVSDNSYRFLVQAEVGYKFQPNVYGTVRYQHGTERYMQGVSVGVGYRF